MRQNVPVRKKKGEFFAGILILALGMILLVPAAAQAFRLTLAWDRNTEADLAGYKIYIGYAPQKYSWTIDVGDRTTGTVDNLVEGTTYYFTLTAYNSKGLESGFSNEVRFPELTYPYKFYFPLILQGPR
jgi:hypothetical protein